MKRIPNHVDPYGERSLSMGRRTATLTGNADFGPHISCTLEVQSFSADRKYLRLFFLDEANALAFGHRPCGTCSKAELKAFKAAWKQGTGLPATVGAIDTKLKAERGKLHKADAKGLPSGTMIDIQGEAYLVTGTKIKQWTWGGYGMAEPIPNGSADVITPPSVVATLAAGYTVRLHESAAPSTSVASALAGF